MSQFATIVVDPPWRQKGGPLKGGHGEGFVGTAGSFDLPYPTMTVDEISALPVGGLAAPDAHLYLWVTNKYMPAAFDIARCWGFRYSTLLVWAKNPMGGGLGGAYGISTEFCLFATRGSLKALSRVRGTWFNWKRPYNAAGKPRSSAKPPEFFAQVEAVSPGPHLELFAREKRDGWSSWGNEVESDIVMPGHEPSMHGFLAGVDPALLSGL